MSPLAVPGLLALLLAPPRAGGAGAEDSPVPAVLDPDLEIRLFADSSQIVTPIGLAAASGRLYAIESHTHSPPPGYQGPRSDQVKVLEDRDGDGRADAVVVFATGLEDAMTLGFSPRGDLWVCHRRGVTVLHDRDGDLRCEARAEILRLDTPHTYDHSGLLGIAFSPGGRVFVSRGNAGGHPWSITSAADERIEGYGDGGAVYCFQLDGSGLREVATGFWNPFGLEVDGAGRLLVSDNDPDARGPNRLVHAIEGGDYGFRALYGPRGTHSYDAWAGELPGTLPFVSGTGEAPAAVLDCERAALPPRYRGAFLVAVWGGQAIEVHHTRPRGVSLAATAQPLVRGGSRFRPVGLAAGTGGSGADGAVFISDWVLKDYPNHGEGRIWKLVAKPGAATVAPRRPFEPPRPDEGARRLAAILDAGGEAAFEDLLEHHSSADPFVRTAAATALSRPLYHRRLLEAAADGRPRVRLLALLALRKGAAAPGDAFLERLLADPDSEVRGLALRWIGELGRTRLRPALDRALAAGEVPPVLLRTYLDTLEILSPETLRAVAQRVPGFRIQRSPPQEALARLMASSGLPRETRALAVAMARPAVPEVFERLAALARGGPEPLRAEAVRTLAGTERAAELLVEIALDRDVSPGTRADAASALAGRAAEALRRIEPLLHDPAGEVRIAAARVLRRRELLAGEGRRPASLEEWVEALAHGGDPEAGRRVFFHPAAQCSRCHAAGGRGGGIGPDLSSVADSKTIEEIVRSVLYPAEEIATEYLSHVIVTGRGEVHHGLQFHFRRGGAAVSLLLEDGREIEIPLDDVAHYEASRSSLMPDDLAALLAVSELGDLVAYLATLRTGRGAKAAIRVAGVVLKWIRGDREANFRRVEPLIRRAAAGGADLVCTTECFLDGYAIADKSIPLETYRALAEPIPGGVYFRRLAALADELDVHLVAGMLEADGRRFYNTAVLFGPRGELRGAYRKQRLGHELARNSPGDHSSVFDLPAARLGVMICADRRYPEVVRGFRLGGADFLVCPSGGMFGPEKNDHYLQARSRENGMFIVFVHPAEFLVTAPDGSIVAREILGDRLAIDSALAGSEADSKGVFYFDVPVAR